MVGGDERWTILEHLKEHFGSAAGRITGRSSSASSDLLELMREVVSNAAPLLIKAFYEACCALQRDGIEPPDADVINRVLAKHGVPFAIQAPNLVALDADAIIAVSAKSESLARQAQDLIHRTNPRRLIRIEGWGRPEDQSGRRDVHLQER